MRIISPFHDYYDTALGLGHDSTRVYRREVDVKVVRVGDFDPHVGDLLARPVGNWKFEATLVVIGFCGRLYPTYLAPSFSITVESLTTKLPSSPVMTRQELVDYYAEVVGEEYDSKWTRARRSRRWDVLNLQGVPASAETFRFLDAPIWLAHLAEWKWNLPITLRVYTNVRLANLDFQKHFDAYTAFQEIAMFLGSTLAKTDDSVRTVGGDEIVASQKGFGPESFRNSAPSVRKARRKENRARKKGDVKGEE